MNRDPFTNTPINDQGIWLATNCLQRERTILETIVQAIEDKGYKSSPHDHRIWTKGGKKVVVCLVDDLRSASRDYETDTPYLFDHNTTIITDNYLSCPTRYRVLRLPASFFHIYCHEPNVVWRPDRDFCFSVNRIDPRRFNLMLELGMRAHLSQGYINFNCQLNHHFGLEPVDLETLRTNFDSHFDQLPDVSKEKYRAVYRMLQGQMPYRNYDASHEDIHVRSRCNMIVESYGSDNTVALSEKIFRALVLPVPWTLYGGHYAVAYLESLGFDCMSDTINHNHYDQLKEIEDRMRIFIWFSLKWTRESQAIDREQLAARCYQAADHNRALLREYQQRWPNDFDLWLNDLDQQLSTGTHPN